MIPQQLKSPPFQEYLVLLIVNVNTLTTGLGVSWSVPTLVTLLDVAHQALGILITTEATLPSVASIGFLGGLAYYYILLLNTAERIGSKQSLLMAGVIRIISYSILLLAKQPWMVMLGRLLCGFSDAFAFHVSGAEVASKVVHKELGLMFEVSMTVAISTVLSVGPYVDNRCLNLTALSTAIASFILTYYLPERSYYCSSQG
ncbi:uncharacterized protein LOC105398297 [Plutella xylostella]|uniref:uncharacterized protein LOC105398297 n=1 Tax=Plutella xylostella TaxID=51655 RepID=UPI0020322C39|nr:uncharacterized protein LOC105398297 [Plutella xylostella]